MTEQVPASVRYKELTDLATTAGERLRRRESERATELGEAVASGRRRIEEAAAQRDQVYDDLRKRWNATCQLIKEDREFPDPDRSAPPATPEESRRAVQNAIWAVHETLDKPRFSAASLLPRRRRK